MRNAIVCHTGNIEADTLEGRLIKFADRIAYINHDIDDAVRGGVINAEEIPPELCEILGISVPSIELPVCPGRNLSIVIEVAAMNNRQKKMGYNTAAEFNKRLMESMGL